MTGQSTSQLETVSPTRNQRVALRTFVTLAVLVVIQLPHLARAQSGDDSSSAFTGGPLLAGATAGTPEGGSLAIAGALASADPSTGIAHSSFSFRLETARGKVQPILGLTYSSADGQREAGIGWGLNIASIERRNVSGGPKYKDPPTGGAVTASTDRFEFGGSPLVPICNIGNAGDCKGALAGEVMPSWAKSGWNYFRLEVDNTYERFFWSPDHKTWRVQTKIGETREYGAPTDNTREDGGIDWDQIGSATPTGVVLLIPVPFRWNLVRRYDAMSNANAIVYVWRQLSDSALGTSPIGSLTDIYDTSLPGAPSNPGSFAHHTQLVWEANPSAVPSSLQPRIFRVRPIFLLEQVNVWSMGFEASGNRGLVRSYALTYSMPDSRSVQYARFLLESVQMTGACPNVSDSGAVDALLKLSCATLPATTFTYNFAGAPTPSPVYVVRGGVAGLTNQWSTMSHTVPANSTFVDLDGDGYPDAVIAAVGTPPGISGENSPPQFARNIHGTSFASASALPFWHTGNNGTLEPNVDYFAMQGISGGFSFGNWGQISGPGTDGFFNASVYPGAAISGFYVAQNYRGKLSVIDTTYGSAANPPSTPWCFTSSVNYGSNTYTNGVTDLDGDGFPDCWSIAGQIVRWPIPNGGGEFSGPPAPYFGLTTQDADGSMHPFAATENNYSNHPAFDPTWNLNSDLFDGKVQVPYTNFYTPLLADITGDGIPDLVWLWSTVSVQNDTANYLEYISVSIGNGDGTFGNGFTIPMPACASNSAHFGVWPDSCAVALVDLNGDGFADFVTMDSVSTTITLSAGVTSKGIQWGTTYSFPPAPFQSALELYGPEFVDLNASGVVDLLYVAVSGPATGPMTGFEPGTVSYIDLLRGQPPPLLKTVSNGLGATTTLTYDSTANLGFEATSTGHPWGTTSTQSVHVVTSITTEIIGNKAAGGPFITSYEYQGASKDEYAGAMYDKRFRRFNGFSFVRAKLTDQSRPGIYDVTDTYYAPSLSSTTQSADVPWDAVKGLAVFSTRYAAGNDSPVTQPLSSSHTTYKVSRLYKGIDGRLVRQVVPEITDTWLYDPAKPSHTGSTTFTPLQDVDDVSGGAPSVSRARTYEPLAWPSRHIQSNISVDAFGNMTAANDEGILGTDQVITRSWKWSAVDNVWNWCPTRMSVKYAGDTTDRQYDFTYDSAGHVIEITGNLSGTLPIRQNASQTPLNASPQSDPALVLAVMDYDPQFGNLIATSAGSALRIAEYQYDTAYQQLLTRVDLTRFHLSPGSGSQGNLTTSTVYDRGLEVPTQITDASSGLTKAKYDIFGRVVSVQLPDPTTPGVADIQSGVTVSYTDVPGGPYQRSDIQRHLGSVAEDNLLVLQVSRRTIYTDALGGVAAVLSSGGAKDPPGQWIVSRITQRDSRGNVSESYESFFALLTNGLPGAAPPALPPGTKSVSFSRDPFGRIVQSNDLDGELLRKYVYHDLSLDTYDAKDAVAATAAPTYSTVVLDGHRRAVEWDQFTANAGGGSGTSPDALQTKVSYLATGEPTVLTRGSTQQSVLYRRWMQYDSLGRMVLNAEPNTSTGFVVQPGNPGSVPAGLKAWMYAYDAIGDLVGTADARGCGINYTYDFAGRETSEDYIPCTPDQAPYTPVDLSTGVGAEVWNVYDTLQTGGPNANSAGAGTSPFLVGKLVETYSRGEHTVYSYDGRGRVTNVLREMPKPPGATNSPSFPGAPATIYAPTSYQLAVSYDEADRPIAQSTGVTASELQGNVVNVDGAASGGTSVVTTEYDLRNIPTLVSGSYGVLASGEQRDPDGRLLGRSYGDLAGTTAIYTYDGRKRLQTANVSRAIPPSLWMTSKLPGYAVPSGTSFTTPLVLQNLSYSYDEVNNPLFINDFRSAGEWPPDAGPFGTTLTYDDLYRLTSVGFAYVPFKKPAKLQPLLPVPQLAPFTSNDAPPISFKMPIDRLQSQTFGYDLMGNVTSSIDDADALLQRSAGTATYGNANSGGITGPNQLAHSQSDNGAYATAYDAAGNLTSITANLPGGGSSRLNLTLMYQWDEAGHLQRATRSEFNYNFDLWNGPIQFGPSSTITNDYLYDGGGTRTWQSSDDTGSTQYHLEIFPSLRVRGTTWGAQEVPCLPGVPCLPLLQYQDYDLTDKTEQVYLVSGAVTYGRLVRDSTLPSPSQQPLHTFLEIADPHGSTSSAIDKETGELVEQITYLANGQTETDYRPERWNSFRETYRYTGKEDDYDVGLIYYGARYFVPGIGRWASPDPLTIHALGADLNPYSFVRAAPYRYVDPLGLQGEDDPEETDECDSQSQVCQQTASTCNQCTQADAPSPGPYAVGSGSTPGGGGYLAPPPPPPPPTAQPIVNLVSNQASSTFTAAPQSRSEPPASHPYDNSNQGCNSMHTENCVHEFDAWTTTGVFLLAGKEFDNLGVFGVVGYSPKDGVYLSGIVEVGTHVGPLTVAYGVEKEIYSSKGLFTEPVEQFVDANVSLPIGGIGVMAPSERNLQKFGTRVLTGQEASYEFSPYVFISPGPIEIGAGFDTNTSTWGWKHYIVTPQ